MQGGGVRAHAAGRVQFDDFDWAFVARLRVGLSHPFGISRRRFPRAEIAYRFMPGVFHCVCHASPSFPVTAQRGPSHQQPAHKQPSRQCSVLLHPIENSTARSSGGGHDQDRAHEGVAPLRPCAAGNPLASLRCLRYRTPPLHARSSLNRQRAVLRRIWRGCAHWNDCRGNRFILGRSIEHARSRTRHRAGTGHAWHDHCGRLSHRYCHVRPLRKKIRAGAAITEHRSPRRLLLKVHAGKRGMGACDPPRGQRVQPVRRQWCVGSYYHSQILSAWRALEAEQRTPSKRSTVRRSPQSQYSNRQVYWTERSVKPSINTTTLRPAPPETAAVSVGAPPG